MQTETYTREALEQAAAQLPGKPVTMNGRTIGFVLSAEADVQGTAVTLMIEDQRGRALLGAADIKANV